MARHDYLPYTDQGVETWSTNFSTKVSAQYATLGITQGDATQLASLKSDYSTRLTTASNPDTKNRVATRYKNIARSALKAKIRILARIIMANPAVSDGTREELGLHVRDLEPTPVPVPATRPTVRVETLGGLQTGLRLADELSPDRTRKADGTSGALLYAKIDGPAPTSIDECKFVGLTTRARHVLNHPPTAINKTVWIIAQWINDKGEAGPPSIPASASIAA